MASHSELSSCVDCLWRKAALNFWQNINFPFLLFTFLLHFLVSELRWIRSSALFFFSLFLYINCLHHFYYINSSPPHLPPARQDVQEEAYGTPLSSPQCPSMKLSIATIQNENGAMAGKEFISNLLV